MLSILSEYSDDLAEMVISRQLSTFNVDDLDATGSHLCQYPTVTWLDWLFGRLARPRHKSAFLVGDDVFTLAKYCRTLALLFANPEKFAQTLLSRRDQFETELLGYRTDAIIRRMVGWKFRTFDMTRFLELAPWEDIKAWDDIFQQLRQETASAKAILVSDDFYYLYTISPLTYPARSMFYELRASSDMRFISPISWTNYVQHIEEGPAPNILWQMTPILLSPRPTTMQPCKPGPLCQDEQYCF